ncbi:PP2C family protein-serine/threonine phosphatase [Limnobacter sp.]|uniref:PP2C family protein-serine/threonine phosphatase n=1 Tax=Limnobacter sp. TaxID=2003368 RepID=UPI002FE3566D
MELTIQLSESGSASPLRCRVVERSDTGDRQENQDTLGHRRVGDWLVCVLADGAGGHRGGEVASRHAVNAMLDAFTQAPTANASQLLAMVHRVNHGILETQQANDELADMHTTVCVLVLNQRSSEAVCVHVGDSRVYHFQNNCLKFRTKDHSILQWMTDNGQMKPDATRNALYTALGEPPQQLQVEVSSPFVVLSGDWFLLCSDGIWEHFSDDELALLGSNLRNDSACAGHIHELALSRAGGRADNLSSILVFIDQAG